MLLNNNTATYVTNNNSSAITITQGYTGTGTTMAGSIGSVTTLSTLSGYTTGSIFYSSSSTSMIEIEVLGKKFEVYPDTIQQTYLAQIDFLGIGYWESMKKMSLTISNEEIRIFLDKKLKSWKRQQKIKKITDES